MANNTQKKPHLVGGFIRKKREELGLSQRALGLQFNPPVTTQFISNLERGVTPLPPAHIPNLTKALTVKEEDFLTLLEHEYAMKLSNFLGHQGSNGIGLANGASTDMASVLSNLKPVKDGHNLNSQISNMNLPISAHDYSFISLLYQAFCGADKKTRDSFVALCENILSVPKAAFTPEKAS